MLDEVPLEHRREFRNELMAELEKPLVEDREDWGLSPEAIAEAERADALWGDVTFEGGVGE